MDSKTMKIIVVINCGSSSLKYQVLDMAGENLLCKGLVEKIGLADSQFKYTCWPGTDREQSFSLTGAFPDHDAAMRSVAQALTDPERGGVLKNADQIMAVGHRVVLGSPEHSEVRIDSRIKEMIQSYVPLSPLHNPVNLIGIEVAERLWPGKPNVAVFDTGFHSTMPPRACTYGIDKAMAQRYRIRRYGYHGSSHRFVSRQAAALAGRELSSLNLISCHLGAGCSLCAIQNGKSIDTSMGLSPLGGLVMASRSGDLDPAIVTHIMGSAGLTPGEMDRFLNNNCGLKGMCGFTDMRQVLEARENGDPDANLAFEVFCYSIRKFIGSCYAVLDRVDGLIFTGGIGENAAPVRAEIVKNMKHMGLVLDDALNNARNGAARTVSSADSGVPIYVIPTNEELEIARATLRVLDSTLV